MTPLVFPDNTVLVNFAHCNEIELLERLLNGRGRWCATVEEECQKSSRIPGLSALTKVSGFLGEAMRPDDRELFTVDSLLPQLQSAGDGPEKSLGEAETIAIAANRFPGSVFVTDDNKAARAVKKLTWPNSLDITVISTWDLFGLSVRANYRTVDDLWNWRRTLLAEGRGMPPHVRDRALFEAWLSQISLTI